jgi:hypothetical protein
MHGLNWINFWIRGGLKAKAHWLSAHDEAIARWVSNVLSPPLIAGLLAIGFARFVVPNPDMLWRWLLLSVPLISLPPLVYVIWLVRRGELADIHMPHRRSRIKPLGVITTWLLLCIVLLSRWGAPAALNLFLVGTLVQIGILSLVTLFWQISFHSAVISAAAASSVAIGGATLWPIIISLLVPLVGWSRVRLRRHTFRQVTAGCVVGTLVALALILGLWPCFLSAETG